MAVNYKHVMASEDSCGVCWGRPDLMGWVKEDFLKQ